MPDNKAATATPSQESEPRPETTDGDWDLDPKQTLSDWIDEQQRALALEEADYNAKQVARKKVLERYNAEFERNVLAQPRMGEEW